jgi:hypothetical protein
LGGFRECLLFQRFPALRADLLGYRRVADDRKQGLPLKAPRLPERAAIYIAPDGSVHFGALFEGLLPVAQALGASSLQGIQGVPPPRPEVSISRGSDTPADDDP